MTHIAAGEQIKIIPHFTAASRTPLCKHAEISKGLHEKVSQGEIFHHVSWWIVYLHNFTLQSHCQEVSQHCLPHESSTVVQELKTEYANICTCYLLKKYDKSNVLLISGAWCYGFQIRLQHFKPFHNISSKPFLQKWTGRQNYISQ